MKLGLINSVFAQAGKGTKYGIQQTAKIGFDTVDIQADPLDIDVRERKLIKSTADQCGLPIKSVCCVAAGLVDFNPSVQRFSIDRVKAHLDFCYELGADNLLLVVGEYVWEQQVIPPEVQWNICVENVRVAGKYAKRLGLEIVMELEPFKRSLINSVDTMERFLDDVALSNVLANCDISHLHLVRTPIKDTARLAGRIGHVHLSDCNGKIHGDLPPGRGVTPIRGYLKVIRDTGYDRTVSVELEFPPQPDRVVEWVTEAYERTDQIMQSLGCRG
jgi:sugar phosphate isomerase/epimerase